MNNETDSIVEDVHLVEDEDPRIQLWERIAEGVASLSEITDAPIGVNAASFAIEAVEIGPSSRNWMAYLAEVQGWLHLSEKLDPTDIHSFLVDLIASLDLDSDQGIESESSTNPLSILALERLSQRIEYAVRLQQSFIDNMESESVTLSLASKNWESGWEEYDVDAQQLSTEPVAARADVVSINEFTTMKLNLNPSYQRGDVWTTNDRQALIESVLRGIPIPSIILRGVGSSASREVVDGKQRLTTLLRFIGKHPAAKERVEEADKRNPEAGLKSLFEQDYLKFKRVWRRVEGETLTAAKENEYFFPFKLRNNGSGGLAGPQLKVLQGKYYTEILNDVIKVAGEEMTVEALFTTSTDYKIPVIRYIQADPRQIHDVFKLYNKQGVHLNAEELRNAAFHEISLTPSILAAAGDADPRVDIKDIAPALASVDRLSAIVETLDGYGIGRARYRRTKILSWILAVLLLDTGEQKVKSTARHIDAFLTRIQDDNVDPLRNEEVLTDLFEWLAEAFYLHASYPELWSDKFKDGNKGVKWQELQLVGSMVGIAYALAACPDDIKDRLNQHADKIRAATEGKEWERIKKTQTRTQWDYIARIAKGLIDLLDIDPDQASKAVIKRFGSSGYESLERTILADDMR